MTIFQRTSSVRGNPLHVIHISHFLQDLFEVRAVAVDMRTAANGLTWLALNTSGWRQVLEEQGWSSIWIHCWFQGESAHEFTFYVLRLLHCIAHIPGIPWIGGSNEPLGFHLAGSRSALRMVRRRVWTSKFQWVWGRILRSRQSRQSKLTRMNRGKSHRLTTGLMRSRSLQESQNCTFVGVKLWIHNECLNHPYINSSRTT